MEKVILGMYARLVLLQNELKAPKSQMNKFGGYKYRNNEDILEAVKPLLKKYDFTLVLSDDVVMIGERYYVKVTAKLFDTTIEGLWIENSALAREEENKKGMDSSQITGASSSYARKYALNGLFAIDDTKDSDTTNDGKSETPKVDENGVSDRAKQEIAKARAKKVETPKVEAKPLVDLPPFDEDYQVEENQAVFSQSDLDMSNTLRVEDREDIEKLLNKLPMARQIAFLNKYLKDILGYPSIGSIEYKDFAEIKAQLEKAVAQTKV